ncbi:hypothetical protein [Seleniivibrio sp.]|uniref:hypothetical protein n=1 Tax=Seleniivibrio sp. TaxID=2898801 RepID=UPI0025DCAE66|nr:hypothetical protein [Seleniivibrio sp.]MCD8554315.1 hypothetical protein [Seleniivibrio sp.]
MKRLLMLFLLIILTSCANIKDTVVPPTDAVLRDGFNNKVVYSKGCTSDGAYLKVLHYQGILRIPTPAFFAGFPQDERDSMLRMSVQIAAFAFFKQLEDSGAVVRLYSEDTVPEADSIVLMCNISKIKIGIYDNGWGGYGSAGDFWEAETDFNLKVYKNGTEYVLNTVIGKGQLKHAPISPGSFLDAIILSAKMATAAINGSMFGVVKNGFIDYDIDRDAKSPVEPAAGLAAIEAVKQLATIK